MHRSIIQKAFVLGLSLSVFAACQPTVMAAYLNDINGHWAQQQIQALNDRSIIGGYPNGAFNPEGTITRAELASVLVKALNLPVSTTGYSSFNDVPSTHWASPSIEAVKKAGLVNGYPGGLFMPNQAVSRLEAMAILANANPTPYPTEAQTDMILSRFVDQGTVPAWGQKAVAETIETGVFANKPNSQNHIDPSRAVSRGEVAAMVSNLLNMSQNNAALANNPNNSYDSMPTNTAPMGYGNTASYPNTNTNMAMGNTMSAPNGMQQPLQGYLVTIPAQTEFSGTVKTPISSELANVGDQVKLSIDQPLVSTNNVVVIPVGSEIIGTVSEVNPTKRLGKPATLSIRFKEIVVPDGKRIPIEGSVATETGMLEAGSTKGRVLSAVGKTALGAGLGAALGTAMGPLSGGKVGKGAIYGTAVGAGVGALAAAGSKGEELEIKTGEQLKIRLNEPIQMTSN